MAAGSPPKTSTDSESLAIDANVRTNYVECTTSIQQPRPVEPLPEPTGSPLPTSTSTTNIA